MKRFLSCFLSFFNATNVAAFLLFFCVCGILFALFMQHIIGHQPCPLCVVQRMEMILDGFFAAFALVFSRFRKVLQVGLGLSALFSILGFLTASWQVYIQANPPEFVECAPGIDFILATFPISEAIPVIFSPYSDCAIPSYVIPGILTIPQASLLAFIFAFFVACYGIYRSVKPYDKTISV